MQVPNDQNKRAMQMASLLLGQKVRYSAFGFPGIMKAKELGQPTFLIAAFFFPSLMRVGDLCMHIKICRRLLD